MTDGLEARLERGPISAYVGFDPTGPSLHVGHLIQVFLLIHLQRAGGRPVALIGGGTGMIGDPSGKSAERNLIDDATLDRNKARIREQLARFIDFADGSSWRGHARQPRVAGPLHAARVPARHRQALHRRRTCWPRSRSRSGSRPGSRFTEFSYMTLQAADFLHLYREHGVEMQMGGADQWGNITAGLELIRRVEEADEGDEAHAFALCSPLLDHAPTVRRSARRSRAPSSSTRR